ncbi:hypothetical protein ACTXT7_014003 [Hymenolepis weldensis]
MEANEGEKFYAVHYYVKLFSSDPLTRTLDYERYPSTTKKLFFGKTMEKVESTKELMQSEIMKTYRGTNIITKTSIYMTHEEMAYV